MATSRCSVAAACTHEDPRLIYSKKNSTYITDSETALLISVREVLISNLGSETVIFTEIIVPSGKFRVFLKLHHGHFLPHTLQFITHQSSDH